MKRGGLKPQGALQRFQKSNVLGDIIVLVSDPFGDPDCAVGGTVNYDSDTRWTRIPERAAIDVSHEVRHCVVIWYQPCLTYFPALRCLPDSCARSLVACIFEHLWKFLCKNGKNLISHSLSDNDSIG